MRRLRKHCGWLCMHKHHQAGSVLVPSDTVLCQWHHIVEHKLKVEYLTGPSYFSKNTSLWYITKTKYYWVNRRLPLIQLSCSIEISNNRHIFWVDDKMSEVRAGWWNWLMHWDISPSKVPADLPKQLFNFHRHIMQSQKKRNSEINQRGNAGIQQFSICLEITLSILKLHKRSKTRAWNRKSILIKSPADTTTKGQNKYQKKLYYKWEERVRFKLCDTEEENSMKCGDKCSYHWIGILWKLHL